MTVFLFLDELSLVVWLMESSWDLVFYCLNKTLLSVRRPCANHWLCEEDFFTLTHIPSVVSTINEFICADVRCLGSLQQKLCLWVLIHHHLWGSEDKREWIPDTAATQVLINLTTLVRHRLESCCVQCFVSEIPSTHNIRDMLQLWAQSEGFVSLRCCMTWSRQLQWFSH